MTSQAHILGTVPPSRPPGTHSLLLPAFPGAALLVTSADAPGSKLIIKLKREGSMVGGVEDMPHTQTFFVTGMPLGWAAPCRDGPSGPGIRTVLLTKAGEEPGGRKSRGPDVVPSGRVPPPGDASFACTSKGVYENYRRWQRYKGLARCHFPATPDAEALACFFIPVLRSLARLRPNMTLEDGVPRAVQEWEHSSNFERMIFYEMAEKFMEFEAEEEQQIQKMKLLASCSQFQGLASKPSTPPSSPQSGAQQVYIPKKSASKSRQPRRRQRHPPSTSTPGAPREIPAEAVHQYAEIMEGLDTSWEEEDEKKEQGMGTDPQDQENGVFPDHSLLQYIDQLCGGEEFVCKVEAVIHPQFMANLLSPEKSQDPLDLVEELTEELNLTPSQLIEKRLLALSEEEREPSVCPTSHSDSTSSQSEEEDEANGNGEEDTSGQAMKRPSPAKDIRISWPELLTPAISSLVAPHSHQRLSERDVPPKGIRSSVHSSPQVCGSHDTQGRRALPSQKSTSEREIQNLRKEDQGGVRPGQVIKIAPQVQQFRLENSTASNAAENNHLIGSPVSQRNDKVGQRVQRPQTAEQAKRDGSREEKTKGQADVPRATEQDGQGARAQFHIRTQIDQKNVDSSCEECGKQDSIQQGKSKQFKKLQAIWEGQRDVPKGGNHDSQNINKPLCREHTGEGKALKLTLNGDGEQNINQAEKVTQIQISQGSEDTSNRKMLDSPGEHMLFPRESQIKQSSLEVTQLEHKKQDPRQGEGIKDQSQVQATCLEPKANSAATKLETTNPSCKALAVQEHFKSIPAGPGKQLDSVQQKVKPQTKTQIGWDQTKAGPIKNSEPDKSLRWAADNLALQNQANSTREAGQELDDTSVGATDQDMNGPIFKRPLELSGCNQQQQTLKDPSGVGVLDEQLTSITCEPPPYLPSAGLQSQLPSTQNGPGYTEKCQASQPSLPSLAEPTPSVGNPSGANQTLNPSFNPSGCTIRTEGDGSSCGPSGDHPFVPPNTGKETVVFPEHPNLQGSSSRHENHEPKQKLQSNNRASSKTSRGTASSENEGTIPNKMEGLDLLGTVPGPTECNLENGPRHDTKKEEEEEEEEDEELSGFSSLLASKLSLSANASHIPLPSDQGDTASSPTDKGKKCAKTKHSTYAQVPQNSVVSSGKKLEAISPVHRCHKRKSSSTGTRRSKRLRNQ